MAEELKACPFCSCTDIGEVTINLILEQRHRRFKVYCKACQCRTSEHKTRKEARIYWNTRAQLPSQGGEAVEVVGYGCEGQIEVLKHVPLTGGMKVSGREREKYNVPLMTVAQHERILAARVGSAEPVAWHTEDQLTDKSATTYDPEVAKRWRAKGWPVTPLYTHPADQVADDLTMAKVSRELLELLCEMVDLHGRRGTVLTVHMEHLRALLTKPST